MSGSHSQETFDVAIIGAGVVGCATARRFALEGARVVLLEQGADILAGASKANSAILHTGFDAPEDSLELDCMQRGYAEYQEISEHFNLPTLTSQAMVVAWTEEDEARLDGIVAKAHRNGVTDVHRISRDDVIRREPQLASSLKGGVVVPGEHLIDPWSAPLAYATQALMLGAVIKRNVAVNDGDFDGGHWTLHTSCGDIRATTVINCAGLYGDRIETALLGTSEFEIRPRKGQFVVFDKAAADLINSIILPVPGERTKGVVLTRTVFGNLLVGPTAEEQSDRQLAGLDHAVLQSLIDSAVQRIPALHGMPVTATYAGLRPATERKEYRCRYEASQHYLVLGGVRSTGLTASLGLAQYAYKLYARQHQHTRPSGVSVPAMPNLAEHLQRDWQQPNCGEIACHCEWVTKREIENAFASPLPPTTLSGLKRRTRACMGRCQGFYCGARIAEMTQHRFAVEPTTDEPHD